MIAEQDTWPAILRAFIRATVELGQDEAADKVGVDRTTISRWRKLVDEGAELPTPASPKVRRALRAYLESSAAADGNAEARGLLVAAERMEGLARELREEAKRAATPPSDAVARERDRLAMERAQQVADGQLGAQQSEREGNAPPRRRKRGQA